MSNKVSENYLDYLLESMNGEAKPKEEPEKKENPKTGQEDQYNIAFEEEVPELNLTSDDEFLQSFEKELESDAYRNYFADFEEEMEAEEERNRRMSLLSGEMPDDIDALLQEMEQSSQKEDLDEFPYSGDGMQVLSGEDILAGMTADSEPSTQKLKDTVKSKDKTADSVVQQDEPEEELHLKDVEEIGEKIPGAGEQEDSLHISEHGEQDLTGVSDEDLIQMLAKAEGLTDIGEILPNSNTDSSAGETQPQDVKNQTEKEDSSKKAKKEKRSWFAKFKDLLFGKDEDETNAAVSEEPVSQEEIPVTESAGPIAELSEENQQILMELGEEDFGGDAEEEDKKTDRTKTIKATAKKSKNKKPAKAKAQKSAPAKKPKKPQEQKVQEHTPPLPKVPVILSFVLAASFVVLVLFGTETAGYSLQVSEAKVAFDNQDYSKAYQKLAGMSVKKKDRPMYQKICVLARVDSEYQSYLRFNGYGNQEAALDSLVCAAGRVAINYENAETAECLGEMDALAGMIEEALSGQYGMTMEEAQTIYDQKTRYEYSILIHKKLIELGLEQETI